MTTEIYKRYRPKNWEDVIGQESAVAVLKEKLEKGEVPHSLLFTGPSGCGKTTAARILRRKLDCKERDFNEINASSTRGIDMIRSIQDEMQLSPWGKCKIFFLEECHSLSREAMEASLLILEDTPAHVYFFLATTNPTKLIDAIRTRCMPIEFKSLNRANLQLLLTTVLEKEKAGLPESVTNKLIETADGSARRILVNLEKVIGLGSEQEQLDAIQSLEENDDAFKIVKALLWEHSKTKWSDVQNILRNMTEEPEGIRRLILANAKNELLKPKGMHARAYRLVQIFSFDLFASGMAGLVGNCFEMYNDKTV
jgi:DNA polymerase III gamma/tau subunit